jgi:hypothetical protein
VRSCAANTRYPSLSQFVSPRQLTGYLPTFQLHSLQRRRDITQVLFPVLTSSDRNTHQYDGLDRGPLVTCPSLAFEACATFEWPGDPQSTSPFHRPRCFCPPPLDTPGIAQHTSHPRTLIHPGKQAQAQLQLCARRPERNALRTLSWPTGIPTAASQHKSAQQAQQRELSGDA